MRRLGRRPSSRCSASWWPRDSPAPSAPCLWLPFDFIGDTLRGTRGILTDMFRQPDVAARSVRPAGADLRQVGHPPRVSVQPSLGLHPPAQGRRRLHERRAVQDLLLAEPAQGDPGAGRGRLRPLPVRRRGLQLAAGDHRRRARGQDAVAVRPHRHAPGQGDPGRCRLHPGQRPRLAAATGHRRGSHGLLPRPDRDGGAGGGFILDVGAVVDDAKEEQHAGDDPSGERIRSTSRRRSRMADKPGRI